MSGVRVPIECVAILTDSSMVSVTVPQQHASLCLNPTDCLCLNPTTAGYPACAQVGVEDVTAVLSALIEAPVLPAGGAVLEVAGERRGVWLVPPLSCFHPHNPSCKHSLTQPLPHRDAHTHTHLHTHTKPPPPQLCHTPLSSWDCATPRTPPPHTHTLSPHLTCCRHGRRCRHP